MTYIHRSLERKFLKMSHAFKVVMVTGARQVGKSTMLKHLAQDSGRTYVSMDDGDVRELANRDPKLFFQMYQPPVLIDEVQKAPALFEQIKILCDESEERGRFWLTGSQSKKLMKQAGDSLAGRIGILKMYSLSAKELEGRPDDIPDSYSLSSLLQRKKALPDNNILDVYSRIWEGGMPDMISMDAEIRREYWNSYIDAYLMRDAVDDNGILDTEGFRKFLRACAAFSGELVNYNDLGSAAGVSGSTAKEWAKVLQTMGIIFLLEPYYNNELKRMIKTPKLYFCDTGLCAFLSSWTSRDTLLNGAASGHYLENYVVSEMLRNSSYGEKKVNLNFYRDTNQKEIDLVLEMDGQLHPFEIKRAASPDPKAIRAFSLLAKSGKEIGSGGIICMAAKPFPINADNNLIPVNLL
ncbi:ATP-binding protein [Porcincola intestinalis]|jgi:predicted AAA+ superfamily ATPase|uniref:ATP-binding protein n=1 Tax=Porcincola intestinalis TaxID=2606632 RepID=UPI002A8358D4|nr:ATP-binding protein [Porcincola intestinalis]MDY4203894.1 ATP-binding protein [Porcincola intestinalis]